MRSRPFRRLALCACAVVLSSYLVLFVVVVSRRVDRSAEDRLQRSIAEDPRRRIHRRIQICTIPGFRKPPGPVTALASFPGSGNTWIRFLVQQATGVLTGSVYRDYSLKRNGFPGEGVCSGTVVLVKTHEWGPKARELFDRALLLLRDPYGALLAEFNRRAGGHVGHAAINKFHTGDRLASLRDAAGASVDGERPRLAAVRRSAPRPEVRAAGRRPSRTAVAPLPFPRLLAADQQTSLRPAQQRRAVSQIQASLTIRSIRRRNATDHRLLQASRGGGDPGKEGERHGEHHCREPDCHSGEEGKR